MAGMLDNYVPVSERLALAIAAGVDAITTTAPVMLTDAMGYVRADVQMHDGRRASGTATFRLDLAGKSAQATNPVEDAETSAVGRALAFLGYEVKRGIASREEVREAQARAEQPRQAQPATRAPSGEVRGAVSRVRVATNPKGVLVANFTLEGNEYTIWDAEPTYESLQDGDVLTIEPGKPKTQGGYFVKSVIAWDAPQAA